MSAIRLTVAVCTHERVDDLRACLARLAPQMAEARDQAELVVVDSGSRPEQAEAIAAAARAVPGARHRRLQTPGLSLARNAGVELSGADWIAFLDDDALPAEDWVRSALALIARLPASCAMAGGSARPVDLEGRRPGIGFRWAQLLSTVELSEEGDCTGRPTIVGANMLVRRSALAQVGGFPEALGRSGRSLLSGEEKLVQERLTAMGWRLWASDAIGVDHVIRPERLTRRWAARRAYWDGVSDERIRRMTGRRSPAARTAKLAAALPLLWVLSPFSTPATEYFLRCRYNWGALKELFFPPRRETEAPAWPEPPELAWPA